MNSGNRMFIPTLDLLNEGPEGLGFRVQGLGLGGRGDLSQGLNALMVRKATTPEV